MRNYGIDFLISKALRGVRTPKSDEWYRSLDTFLTSFAVSLGIMGVIMSFGFFSSVPQEGLTKGAAFWLWVASWSASALIVCVQQWIRMDLQLKKDLLAQGQRLIAFYGSTYSDTINRALTNACKVIENCQINRLSVKHGLALQARLVFKTLCEEIYALAEMVRIQTMNSVIVVPDERMAQASTEANNNLASMISDKKKRINSLDAGLAMLAQASFNLSYNNSDPIMVEEAIATSKALLEVGQCAAPFCAETADQPIRQKLVVSGK